MTEEVLDEQLGQALKIQAGEERVLIVASASPWQSRLSRS